MTNNLKLKSMAIQPITIEAAQKKVDEWISTHGVRYFNELTNMAILTEEVGEVARIISRQYGEQSFKKNEKDKNLADELADVLFVIICIANQTGIDLTKAFEKNMLKKTKRDNKRHKANVKLKIQK
jgi:NTP pyrophosphatase (non-canonical NTP hydrolase)